MYACVTPDLRVWLAFLTGVHWLWTLVFRLSVHGYSPEGPHIPYLLFVRTLEQKINNILCHLATWKCIGVGTFSA